jgi:isoleucyl-tRNA synthetase
VVAGGIELLPGEFTERLVPAGAGNATTALPGNSGLVVLDTTVTPELAAEGTARDVVRVVQQARRDGGFDVSDRVMLTVDGPQPVLDAVRAHEAFVAGEVLATAVSYQPVPDPTLAGTVATDGGPAEIRVLVGR